MPTGHKKNTPKWKPVAVPRKLTPEMVEILAQAEADLVPQEFAAGAVGVTREAVRLWFNAGEDEANRLMKKGNEEEECDPILVPHLTLYLAVTRARFDTVTDATREVLGKKKLKRTNKAGDEYETEQDPKALHIRLDLLARRYPSHFREKKTTELSNDPNAPVTVNLVNVPLPE